MRGVQQPLSSRRSAGLRPPGVARIQAQALEACKARLFGQKSAYEAIGQFLGRSANR
jgi:hypothetical protein